MIEFFEFLNTCSGIRTFCYLLFILVFTFITFAGITDMIKKIRGKGDNFIDMAPKETNEIEDER